MSSSSQHTLYFLQERTSGQPKCERTKQVWTWNRGDIYWNCEYYGRAVPWTCVLLLTSVRHASMGTPPESGGLWGQYASLSLRSGV